MFRKRPPARNPCILDFTDLELTELGVVVPWLYADMSPAGTFKLMKVAEVRHMLGREEFMRLMVAYVRRKAGS